MTNDNTPLNMMADECIDIIREKGFTNDIWSEFPAAMANLHEEVSELWSLYRTEELLDQNEKVGGTKVGEEIIDIVIRAISIGRQLGLDLDFEYEMKKAYNKSRTYNKIV